MSSLSEILSQVTNCRVDCWSVEREMTMWVSLISREGPRLRREIDATPLNSKLHFVSPRKKRTKASERGEKCTGKWVIKFGGKFNPTKESWDSKVGTFAFAIGWYKFWAHFRLIRIPIRNFFRFSHVFSFSLIWSDELSKPFGIEKFSSRVLSRKFNRNPVKFVLGTCAWR